MWHRAGVSWKYYGTKSHFIHSGIAAVHDYGEDDGPLGGGHTAYLVICEALANVLKHSGSNTARVVLSPLPPQVFEQFRALFGHTILERYGMTETPTGSRGHLPTRKGSKTGSLARWRAISAANAAALS